MKTNEHVLDGDAANRSYPLTPADVDAGFAADAAWDSSILDLTAPAPAATILADRASTLMVNALLEELFPAKKP